MTFTEYAKSRGMQLLRDDIRYLKAHVAGMSPKLRHELLRRYCDVWIEAMGDSYQSVGRRAANIWIREGQ